MVHKISPMQLNSGSYTEKIKHLEACMEKSIMMGDQKQSLELHEYTQKIPRLEELIGNHLGFYL
jgi:hypothetical protein